MGEKTNSETMSKKQQKPRAQPDSSPPPEPPITTKKKAREASNLLQPPVVRRVNRLLKAEWEVVQDRMNQVNREEERQKEMAKEKEALHLVSKELIKLWPNTLVAERQKRLELAKNREQIEEDKRVQIDIEESKLAEQKRKDALLLAKTKLFYETNRVKELHGALLLTEVLKEREAQIEMKRRMEKAEKERERRFPKMEESKEEAQKREEEKALKKKLKRQAFAEDLKYQVDANRLLREREKVEIMKDREKNLRVQELYELELKTAKEKEEEGKRNLMQSYMEHVNANNMRRIAEEEALAAEEEKRLRFVTNKDKWNQKKAEKEAEMFKESQKSREYVLNKLAEHKQALNDDQDRREDEPSELQGRRDEKQRQEDEKRAAMIKSIAAHRLQRIHINEQRAKEEWQRDKDVFEGKREADVIHFLKQEEVAQKIREGLRKIYNFNVEQAGEKHARDRKEIQDCVDLHTENMDLTDEEEKQFQLYAQEVIKEEEAALRNAYPLCKVSREGVGGGLGPNIGGVRPMYMDKECKEPNIPNYMFSPAMKNKANNENYDFQTTKARLGFMWKS